MLGVKSTRQPIRGEYAVRLAQELRSALSCENRENLSFQNGVEEYNVAWK